MRKARTFLVIAGDPERLMLVSATLHRKFPNAVVQTCRDSDAAIEVARMQRVDAVVAQRSSDLDELPLVEKLRAATAAPIVLMSTARLEQSGVSAGATHFLHSSEWLLIGTVVAKMIGASASETQ